MDAESVTKSLIKVIKRPPVDIEFNNLSCVIGQKTVLKNVSGKFSSGHLTGILGTSGAGKTTLLNVLAGQLRTGTSGDVLINGESRIIKKFRRVSSYIMQEDVVQPFLTVKESITIAANLKVGNTFSNEEKESMVLGILSVIGLSACMETNVEYLSGGERKRLVIALELVNNPAVIFLDEPTTGLDEVAMRNCIQLLKYLTLQGRTIICTLHQPSDLMFKLFDRVYFMSDGFCIYNGSVPELVPFLFQTKFPCPANYNPADYIIEVAHADCGNTTTLRNAISNGKIIHSQNSMLNISNHHMKNKFEEQCFSSDDYSISFWTQFLVLTRRNYIQLRRNKRVLALHFVYTFVCGLIIGLLFFQVGMKGSEVILNYKCFYSIIIYFLYTHMMSAILYYPFEVKLLEREYFNRWYSLKAYFAAFTLELVPIITLTSLLFTVIVYFLTGQLFEWDRFAKFCILCVLMALASQGLGYAVGTLFNPTRGACIGSASAVPLILLGMYGLGHADTLEPFMKVLMSLSFPYHAFAGIANVMFKDRGNLDCDVIFCLFADTETTLEKMGMADKTFPYEVSCLLFFCILHRILLYVCLRMRVSPDCVTFRSIKFFELS